MFAIFCIRNAEKIYDKNAAKMLRRIGNGSQILKNCKRGRLLVTSKNVFLNSCLVPMVCTKETISSVPTGQKSQKIPTKKLIGQKEAEKFIPEKKK